MRGRTPRGFAQRHHETADVLVAPQLYSAPRWLAGGHAQTIWPYRLRRPSVELRRERIETADGDFWDFDWLDAPSRRDAPARRAVPRPRGQLRLALRACAAGSRCARRLARRRPAFSRLQRRTESPARVPTIRVTTRRSARCSRRSDAPSRTRLRFTPSAFRSAAARCSTGWVEQGSAAAQTVTAAAAVSAPLDLMAAGISIGRGVNRIYTALLPVVAEAEVARDGGPFPGTARSRAHASRANDVGIRRCRHGTAARIRRRRRLLDARIVEAVAARCLGTDARAQCAQRSVHSRRVAADRSRRVGVDDARAAARTAATSDSRAAAFRVTSTGCRHGCYTTSLRAA